MKYHHTITMTLKQTEKDVVQAYLSIHCCISANLKICSYLPVTECVCSQINTILKPLDYMVHICIFLVRHIQ